MKTQPENWDKWSNMVSAHLWEAVALSLNLEPNTANVLVTDMGNLNIRKAPAKFTERLDIAENYVRTGRLEFLNWGNRGGKFCEVELSEFSSWAIEIEWDLPEAFPKTPKMKKPTLANATEKAETAKKGGRTPKYNWDDFYTEIIVCNDLDELPEYQADLEKQMANWCLTTWVEEPAESTIRAKISPIYNHSRKMGS
jgi:hypothetical protein